MLGCRGQSWSDICREEDANTYASCASLCDWRHSFVSDLKTMGRGRAVRGPRIALAPDASGIRDRKPPARAL